MCRLLKLRDRVAAEADAAKLKPPAAVWDEGMSLDCVSFMYPMRNRMVLRDVSINFYANQSTALVGTSGSGKSTAAALLARLLKPTSGTVRLGDFDVEDIDRDWMRHHIAQVPQSPTLFTASVFDNISYGFSEASAVDVEAAAKAADAHDFICRLPDGYGTIVKDSALSGGQRQRIAIARALFRQPRVLVWLLCLIPVLHQCSHTCPNLGCGTCGGTFKACRAVSGESRPWRVHLCDVTVVCLTCCCSQHAWAAWSPVMLEFMQILDEATSALDANTEAAVQQTLEHVIQGKSITVVVIAHRLATVQNCKQIVVLHKGFVAEVGTHDELLVASGLYRDLVAQQSFGDIGLTDADSDESGEENSPTDSSLLAKAAAGS